MVAPTGETVTVLILRGGAWGEHRQAPLFTYAVPTELAGQLAPGHLVIAPFGAQLVMGVVWDDTPSNADPTTIRPIHSLQVAPGHPDATPLLDAARRALAQWLAEAYVCSLADCVRLMLPGLTAAPRIELFPTDAEDPEAPRSAEARALLGLMRQHGGAEEAVVRRALGRQRAGKLISDLEADGALARVVQRAPAPPAPEPFLQLTATTDTIAAWRAATLAQIAPPQPARGTGSGPSARARTPTRRGKGALLQAIATAGSSIAPAIGSGPSAAPGSRTAARLRGAIALLDLLAANPAEPRPRREALRLTRATPAALEVLLRGGLAATLDAPANLPVGTAPFAASPLATPRHALNPAQAAAVEHIITTLDATTELATLVNAGTVPDDALRQAARPLLLHGVTGSGKTEVYLQAMEAAIARGRRGIVLVPEIALTPQAVGRFAARFPGRVALLHSALRPEERAREWLRIHSGAVDVVVGSRSAIFAPLPDLGLIILDEEHESSFKQDERAPTYHAREVAFALGALTGSAVVLGSATPSVESYYRALNDEFALAILPERVSSASSSPPPVLIVDLRAELRDGHVSILSRPLLDALHTTLDRGEQAVIYLNRRGSASCVICRDCGFVVRCGRCDVPLTHHQHVGQLICHYCGWHEAPPATCPVCGTNGIRYFGVGTERVESTVRELFPAARVLRWDNDTVRAHTDHARFARALARHEVDILIGTQMIAKGLDVPGITLVGIIAADVALYLPDYRATERAFQLLTQVAGRAGRGDRAGQVILQTFNPDHFCVTAAARHDFQEFYSIEIAARTGYGYPPFRRFVKLTYTHPDRHACQTTAIAAGDQITQTIAALALPDTDLVGPAPAFMERLRGAYRWQIILRGPDPRAVIAALPPEMLARGWSVDIDPLSSL